MVRAPTRKFPPVNSGGLIEADYSVTSCGPRVDAFPPVNSGGLIEASSASACPGSPRRFPPVNSGGLIEALGITTDEAHRMSFRR